MRNLLILSCLAITPLVAYEGPIIAVDVVNEALFSAAPPEEVVLAQAKPRCSYTRPKPKPTPKPTRQTYQQTARPVTVQRAAPQQLGPYVDVHGRFFDFRQGGGATLWAPVKHDGCGLIFAEAGGGHYRKFLSAFTFGGGYRKLCNECFGWGANAFFDYARSNRAFNYYQGGVGAEAFGPCWVARVNGYAPNISHNQDVELLAVVNETELLVDDLIDNEHSYGGFDVEAGYGLPFCYGEVWGYATYYYFNTKGAKEIQGPRLRLELDLFNPRQLNGPQLSIGGEWSYDQLHKSQGALTVNLRLPLFPKQWCAKGCTCVKRICRRLAQPVHRNRSIWVERRLTEVAEPFVTQNIFFIDSQGGGTGTQTDPTTLAMAESLSIEGDVIFALSNTGDIAPAVTTTLKDFQQLVGFGDGDSQTITLRDGRSVTVEKIDPAGTRPIFADTAASLNPMFTLMTDTQVYGIGFDLANGSQGIRAGFDPPALQNLRFDDIVADYTGAGGVIEVFITTNISLTNSVFTTTNSPGGIPVTFQVSNGTIIIDNNRSTSTGGGLNSHFFLDFENGPTRFFARNNTVAGSGIERLIPVGFSGSDDRALFSGNTFSGSTAASIGFAAAPSNGSVDVTITGNSFTDGVAVDLTAVQKDATSTFTALVNNNTSTNVATFFNYDNSGFDQGQGFSNITVQSNTGTGTTGTAYSLNYSSTNAQTVCYNISGNTDPTAGTVLNIANPMSGGTVAVWPSNVEATLRAANTFNPASTITIGNMVEQAAGPCPLPLLP